MEPGQRRGYGPFGPVIEAARTIYPTPVEHIETAVLRLWGRAADGAPVAVVRARFADLLWEARHGDRPHEYALRAIDEYIGASRDAFGEPIELTEGLQRALELAAQVNDPSRHAQVVRGAVELASRALDSGERKPGVVLHLIESLARLRRDQQPVELDVLIDRAIDRYGDDPWNLESTLEIRARLAARSRRARSIRSRSSASSPRRRCPTSDGATYPISTAGATLTTTGATDPYRPTRGGRTCRRSSHGGAKAPPCTPTDPSAYVRERARE